MRRPIAAIAASVTLLVGCGNDHAGGIRERVGELEQCMDEAGYGNHDVVLRYDQEPAFRRALDDCTESSGVSVHRLFKMHAQANRLHRRLVAAEAECMRELGVPMEVEYLEDGSANLGDVSRYFTPDVPMDRFYDLYAECSKSPRDIYPTEAAAERLREGIADS